MSYVFVGGKTVVVSDGWIEGWLKHLTDVIPVSIYTFRG